MEWSRRARTVMAAMERGESPTLGVLDEKLVELFVELDRADAMIDYSLSRTVHEHAKKDPEFAFDVLRWRAAAAERHATVGLRRAQRDVERNRAAGTHVDRLAIQRPEDMTDDELRAEAQRLAAADLDDTVH